MTRKIIVPLFSIALLGAMAFAPQAQAQQDNPDQRGNQDGQGRRGRGADRGGRGFGAFGGGFGGGVTLPMLLRVDAVRQEVKVTQDQQELIDILNDELREGGPEFPQNYRELTDEQRTAFNEKREQWNQQQSAQAKETLKTILEADQYKRLQEIAIQTQGVNALLDPDVAAALKLTDEQKQKLEQTRQANRDAIGAVYRDAFRGAGGDREAMRQKTETLRAESDAKMLAQLTAEQKTQFEALKGEAFAMPENAFGGRGGRGGRGDGGGGARPGGDRPQRPE